MVHGKNRIPYRIDRRLTGLAGPDYDATISFGLPFESEDSRYGKYRLYPMLVFGPSPSRWYEARFGRRPRLEVGYRFREPRSRFRQAGYMDALASFTGYVFSPISSSSPATPTIVARPSNSSVNDVRESVSLV